ncbi:hypothetical protein [Streptomyces sp. NPDC088789]|uniref:hypothetical protein n=1 Tax=Streptomyces sp. NPDC088789 TaxID=3365899 RepID=UPI00380D547F
MTDEALRLLREQPSLAARAAHPFGFDVDRADHGHVEEVRLVTGGPLEVIAGDDTGGTYFRCADGSVLYASSEGASGLVGSTVDEALETVIGLPDWGAYANLTPEDGEAAVQAMAAEVAAEFLEHYGPGVEEQRVALLAALGLPERPPVELVRLLYAALERSEPEFVLLNAEEGRAYEPLHDRPLPPLWTPVLARGRADLAALRRGDGAARAAVESDAVRRRVVLRTAQFDRAEGDRELLRRLLRREADRSMTDELRLAAMLVGRYGRAEDLPLLHEVRDTDFDTAQGLSELPGARADGAELARWARDLDTLRFGSDPADEPLLLWTGLALDQGLTELARVALIRDLDEIELDQGRLRSPADPGRLVPQPLAGLAREFERLGDLRQALRAQRLYTALQDTAWNRVSARLDQARLEREAGLAESAAATLAGLRDILADPGDGSLLYWHRVTLGRRVAQEHYTLAVALADAGLAREARTVLAAGDAILGRLSEAAARGVRELAEETATWVWGVS